VLREERADYGLGIRERTFYPVGLKDGSPKLIHLTVSKPYRKVTTIPGKDCCRQTAWIREYPR
jgi:hypothetical protein